MEQQSGLLKVRRSLATDLSDPEFYSFIVIARDLGDPNSRSTRANVHITVSESGSLGRGLGFDSGMYRWEIRENVKITRGEFIH